MIRQLLLLGARVRSPTRTADRVAQIKFRRTVLCGNMVRHDPLEDNLANQRANLINFIILSLFVPLTQRTEFNYKREIREYASISFFPLQMAYSTLGSRVSFLSPSGLPWFSPTVMPRPQTRMIATPLKHPQARLTPPFRRHKKIFSPRAMTMMTTLNPLVWSRPRPLPHCHSHYFPDAEVDIRWLLTVLIRYWIVDNFVRSSLEMGEEVNIKLFRKIFKI